MVETATSGSFGTIFRVVLAAEPSAGERALKLARHPQDPRFERESDLLGRCRSPHLPRLYDRGLWLSPTGQSYPWFVMSWVEGQPLYDWARVNKPSSRQVLRVLAQLALALAELHRQGALHRDVKGDNVLVGPGGDATLVDLGCGTYKEARELTDASLPPGTRAYRSPQALRWSWAHRKDDARYEAGPADDVYALGVMAYRLCTGSYPPPPTEGSGAPPRLLAPTDLATVSVGLEQLILRALSERPEARPPADFLALALSKAAEEKDAAQPIEPTPAAAPTQHTSQPGPRRRRHLPRWLPLASAAVVGGLIVAVASELQHRPEGGRVNEAPLMAATWEAPLVETLDGGVGEVALTKAVDFPQVRMPPYAIGLPMPKEPAPGQKRPPCDTSSEVLALGACWVVMAKVPPCGGSGYEYDGRCVIPNVPQPRLPTSGPP